MIQELLELEFLHFTMSGIVNKNIYLGSGLDSPTDNNNNIDNKYEDNPISFVGENNNVLEKLFNNKNYDFRSERNIFSQLAADGASLGAGGQRKIKFYNSPNQYMGSNLDGLLTPQLSPFVGGYEDYTLISQYAGGDVTAPYFDLDNYFVWDASAVGNALENSGDPIKKYDEYKFDPRRRDLFSSYWYHPQNSYYGSIFDDPIVVNVDGGGVFNNENSPYSSTEFKGIPSPSMKEIADTGNFGDYAPGRSSSVTSFTQAKNAIDKYEQTSGVNFPFWDFNSNLPALGSDIPRYYEGTAVPGVAGANFKNISLSNSSWWVSGEVVDGMPVTNTYLEAHVK